MSVRRACVCRVCECVLYFVDRWCLKSCTEAVKRDFGNGVLCVCVCVCVCFFFTLSSASVLSRAPETSGCTECLYRGIFVRSHVDLCICIDTYSYQKICENIHVYMHARSKRSLPLFEKQ